MSRRIVITGRATVEVAEVAEEVVAEMRRDGVAYNAEQKCFVYEGLDDHYRDGTIEKAQARYGKKLQDLRVRQVEENAKKRGYTVKRVKDGDKIKIVLKQRVYV